MGYRVFVAVLLLPIIVGTWGLLYWPWAHFATMAAAGCNNAVRKMTDYFLGGMIGVGNCIVAYAAALLTQWYGFKTAGSERNAYLLVIVPGVALNVIVDVYVTWKVIYSENTNYGLFNEDE